MTSGDTRSGDIRVVLADDHPILREGLKLLINAEPDMRVVGEAANGDAACQIARELSPDVVVLDLSMPVLTGAEAAARLRDVCPDIGVVALTVHEERSYVTQLLRIGARGYVLKRSASSELVNAVRRVAGGGTYIDPSIASAVVDGYVASVQSGQRSRERLSDREYAVLVRVSKGFSNKEIAAALDLSVKTVETYKARGAEKLGLRTRVDLVRYAARHGWLTSTAE